MQEDQPVAGCETLCDDGDAMSETDSVTSRGGQTGCDTDCGDARYGADCVTRSQAGVDCAGCGDDERCADCVTAEGGAVQHDVQAGGDTDCGRSADTRHGLDAGADSSRTQEGPRHDHDAGAGSGRSGANHGSDTVQREVQAGDGQADDDDGVTGCVINEDDAGGDTDCGDADTGTDCVTSVQAGYGVCVITDDGPVKYADQAGGVQAGYGGCEDDAGCDRDDETRHDHDAGAGSGMDADQVRDDAVQQEVRIGGVQTEDNEVLREVQTRGVQAGDDDAMHRAESVTGEVDTLHGGPQAQAIGDTDCEDADSGTDCVTVQAGYGGYVTSEDDAAHHEGVGLMMSEAQIQAGGDAVHYYDEVYEDCGDTLTAVGGAVQRGDAGQQCDDHRADIGHVGALGLGSSLTVGDMQHGGGI